MMKTDFLKILSKHEDFSILTGGKDGKKTLNLMVTSFFAQSCFFLMFFRIFSFFDIFVLIAIFSG